MLFRSDQPDLDAVDVDHGRLLAVAERHVRAQGWVEHVGAEPGEVALLRQLLEVRDAEVELVVLRAAVSSAGDGVRGDARRGRRS